jgi:hypothetical protein
MSPRRTVALSAAPPTPAATRRPTASGVWLGLGLVVAGLGLIALAWGLVAAELDLRDQIAPLVLAGIGGLAVVVIGLATVNAAVARREDDELRRQLAALTDVLTELREAGSR